MTASSNDAAALTDTATTTGGSGRSGNRRRRSSSSSGASGIPGGRLLDRGLSSATDRITAYPLAALAAGVTVGVALAAVLPRSRKEQEVLGAVGARVTEAAREAADTAVEAGRQQIEDIQKNAMAKVGEAVVSAVTGDGGGS